MNYKETIVKRGKWANFIPIEASKMLDYCVHYGKKQQAETWQNIEEDSFDWNLRESVYQLGEDMYDFEDMMSQARKYIKKQCSVSDKHLENLEDDIKDAVLQACADAYADSYVSEAFQWTKDTIIEKLQSDLPYLLGENPRYQILYYSSEDNTLHNEFKYNTDEIRVYLPLAEIKRIRREDEREDFTLQEYIDELPYLWEPSAINWEYFDYYGSKGSTDGWYDYFTEYEEITYEIKKKIKKHEKKVKAYIKHDVSLEKREPLKI